MIVSPSVYPGIYIHIPFCEKKCGYCDFYSTTQKDRMEDFVRALLAELELVADHYNVRDEQFDTVYFGGGTPSLLSPSQLERILATVHKFYSVREASEITLEANPGTLSLPGLKAYKRLGINRLSLGIQSFHDDELRYLGRIHNAHQAVQAIELARSSGFDNINLDLIFAIPDQTSRRWLSNLSRAVEFEPEHIAAYNLIFEQGTPFHDLLLNNIIVAQSEEAELAFLKQTVEFLTEHGYLPYEVSNYARSGSYRSRHNSKYWYHLPYLGFGPSAHSYWKDWRTSNFRALFPYIEALQHGKQPLDFREHISAEKKEFEHIFLRLRTYDGLDMAEFEKLFTVRFTQKYGSIVRELTEHGLACCDGDVFRLTREGIFISDEILQKFID